VEDGHGHEEEEEEEVSDRDSLDQDDNESTTSALTEAQDEDEEQEQESDGSSSNQDDNGSATSALTETEHEEQERDRASPDRDDSEYTSSSLTSNESHDTNEGHMEAENTEQEVDGDSLAEDDDTNNDDTTTASSKRQSVASEEGDDNDGKDSDSTSKDRAEGGESEEIEFIVKKVLGHESYRNIQYLHVEWKPDWLNVVEMYKRGPYQVQKYLRQQGLIQLFPHFKAARKSSQDEVKRIVKHKVDARGTIFLYAEWNSTWEPVDFLKGEHCNAIEKYIEKYDLKPFLTGTIRGRKRQNTLTSNSSGTLTATTGDQSLPASKEMRLRSPPNRTRCLNTSKNKCEQSLQRKDTGRHNQSLSTSTMTRARARQRGDNSRDRNTAVPSSESSSSSDGDNGPGRSDPTTGPAGKELRRRTSPRKRNSTELFRPESSKRYCRTATLNRNTTPAAVKRSSRNKKRTAMSESTNSHALVSHSGSRSSDEDADESVDGGGDTVVIPEWARVTI